MYNNIKEAADYFKCMIGGIDMPNIKPISDLRNNFAEISRDVHEYNEPVFLTKNGYGDMVVMSMEAYENMQFESEIYFKKFMISIKQR